MPNNILHINLKKIIISQNLKYNRLGRTLSYNIFKSESWNHTLSVTYDFPTKSVKNRALKKSGGIVKDVAKYKKSSKLMLKEYFFKYLVVIRMENYYEGIKSEQKLILNGIKKIEDLSLYPNRWQRHWDIVNQPHGQISIQLFSHIGSRHFKGQFCCRHRLFISTKCYPHWYSKKISKLEFFTFYWIFSSYATAYGKLRAIILIYMLTKC